jgi:tRNA A-37 threonylcarbamoyl transferase component Bud32
MAARQERGVSGGTGEWVELGVGGLRWLVLSEHRERLFDSNGLRLQEWLQTGAARVVKHGPHRTVYHVTLPGLSFYLKHYRLPNVRAWLRELVRPAKARLEYERALAVADRQVLTVVPLALGERPRGSGPGESYLLTFGLDGTEPLHAFIETALPRLEPWRQRLVRQRLAVAAGRFIARMHDAGVLHHDLHAGNLLIRLDEQDRPALYLIDLHTVTVYRSPLDWRTSRANLVMFNRWSMLRADRTDRLRFWRAYADCRSIPVPSATSPKRQRGLVLGGLARDLEKLTLASNLRFWRKRDRRCLRTNRYYQRVRSTVARGYAVRDLDSATLMTLAADPDEPFGWPGVTLLKDSRSSTVAEFDLPVNGVPCRVIYKRFRVTAWSDPWTALMRPSAALRSWVYGHGLRERCLPTARPLAVLHRRRLGLSYEGYLLTEKIPNAVELHGFIKGLADLADRDPRAILRCCMDCIARLVRALHHRRLSHRDLKSANVLVQGSTPQIADWADGFGPVWLIDLVGVRRHCKLDRSRRVQNLARLHASFVQNPALTRTDKLRFLRVYLQWGVRGQTGWKRWWHDIERATAAKVARNLRSGRPLC